MSWMPRRVVFLSLSVQLEWGPRGKASARLDHCVGAGGHGGAGGDVRLRRRDAGRQWQKGGQFLCRLWKGSSDLVGLAREAFGGLSAIDESRKGAVARACVDICKNQ